MEFRRESEMLEPVARWLQSLGLMTKTEFALPWGISDLIGCALNQDRVTARLTLRQRRPIGPPIRVMILNRIPDVKTRRSTTLEKLQSTFRNLIDQSILAYHLDRLVADRFVHVTANRTYQKVNGWLPLQDRLLVVELKLSRIQEALRQAVSNRDLTAESFVAFPLSFAERVLANAEQAAFAAYGVGILGVTSSECRVLLTPNLRPHKSDSVAQTHCVEQFWRMRVTGS